jgi:hypothetical protein
VAAARAAGDAAELLEVRSGGHFTVIEPTSPAWAEVARRVVSALDL